MRLKNLAIALIALLALAAIAGAGRADSLWKPASSSLFTDKKAANVGDLVTIIIVENASTSQQAATSTSKKENASVGPGLGFLLKNIPELGMQDNTTTAGQGATSRSTSLAARITAKVAEVRPNGTMVIEGTREVISNKETMLLKVSGIVRREDVAPDNTIQSTYIADAKIEYTGQGPIGKVQKPGLITRIIRVLF